MHLIIHALLLGHGLVLHSSISEGCPVQVPPFASSTDFVLVFVLVPLPHESEHSPYTQSFHSQWIAEDNKIIGIKGRYKCNFVKKIVYHYILSTDKYLPDGGGVGGIGGGGGGGSTN